MTTNGGTMPVPQSQSASLNCTHCGLIFESSTSLQVHNMHYHHQQDSGQTRWGSSPSSTTPTHETTETNNNQPLGKHHIKAISPHQNTIAAADSSDNNPPTPQQSEGEQQNFQNSQPNNFATQNSTSAPPQSNEIGREMNAAGYPFYDQYYHSGHGIEYGHAPPNSHSHLLNGQHQQQEYKTVPSSRYHQQPPFNSSTHNNTQHTNTNPSVQISNNGLSPRVVSSSSPSNHTNSSSPSQIMHIPPGQPTPSPSPKQCDKCGVVCETDGQLIEHSQVAHSLDGAVNGVKRESTDSQQNYPPFPSAPHHYPPHVVKEEAPSDILDLDSQKMVYPPHPDGSLPPMHSLHPLQSMQRHPMMWGHHDAHFIPPHPGYHQSFSKPDYHPPTPPIKNEYVSVAHMKSGDFSPILPNAPGSIKQEYNTIKAEYNAPSVINQSVLPPASTIGNKSYVTDIGGENGNHLTSSPSDFPSTTTPQENGGTFQRSFDQPTSSLPSSKGTSWKSNEARRPKTYNCTACNKWFTSSGHLKRHYNTTLHKNAVKSSGQPDPATLPISAHHHPNRDPNYVGKRRSHHRNQQNQQNQQQQQSQQAQQNNSQHNQQSQLQQQTVVSEPSTRSPDYQPQFSLPSFGSSSLQQGFQQYGSANLHNPSGNGQAGPSVHASQPRGLHQILMSNSDLSISTDNHQALHPLEVSQLHHQQQLQQQQDISIHTSSTLAPIIMQLQQPTSSINSMEQEYPLHINTNIPSYHTTITLQQNYPNITGNHHMSRLELQHQQSMDHSPNSEVDTLDDEQYTMLPSLQSHPAQHMTTYDQMASRYIGGAMYSNEMNQQPYSPDIPEQYHSTSTLFTTASSYDDEMLPQTASMVSAPSSPSVTSSGQIQVPTSSKLSKSSSVATTNDFRCDLCDKVFNKSCYLTQHNKTFHCGDKPFKCQRCGKRFPCEDSHEEHLAKHGGDKPFKCEQCPKAFNHKTDLRRHMCLHSGSKPFSCLECGKGFIRKDHMVKHMDTHKKKLNGTKKAKSGKKKLDLMNNAILPVE